MSLHAVPVPSPTPDPSHAEVAPPGAGLASLHPLLERSRAAHAGGDYAGDLTPREAYELLRDGVARLVDVRTAEERKFVGVVRDSLHVPWMLGTALQRNPRFTRELESKARRDEILLFMCRSGTRSLAAAKAATAARFGAAFNVLEGFEGDLDEQQQRGTRGGWRFHRLPWIQD